MMENIILGLLVLVEICFLILGLWKKSNLKKERSVARIVLFVIFLLLVMSSIIHWGFQWFMLGFILGIQALLGLLVLVRKTDNSASKKSRLIGTSFSRILILVIAFSPALLFPHYELLEPTGEYSVGTKSYTLTDESREEYFTEKKDYRKVTIQYWYPTNSPDEIIAQDKYPLVVFSHGAFGYRMSNYSMFQELASHGYVVCSIDHPYHAFMAKQVDGKTVIANMEFINNAMKASNEKMGAEEVYNLQSEWMKLRTEDMAFVLDYIKKTTVSKDADPLYKSIDLTHIGLLGHSLGGATAAQIGRLDKDVDAVIVLDGTMLGEIIGFQNGKDMISDVPYPKPLMNFYNESHYDDALKNKDDYPNSVAHKNASDSFQVIIKGSGHMNFTDLPIISPILAKLLGTGDVDSRYCIETINQSTLQFFDHYLKSGKEVIQRERTI